MRPEVSVLFCPHPLGVACPVLPYIYKRLGASDLLRNHRYRPSRHALRFITSNKEHAREDAPDRTTTAAGPANALPHGRDRAELGADVRRGATAVDREGQGGTATVRVAAENTTAHEAVMGEHQLLPAHPHAPGPREEPTEAYDAASFLSDRKKPRSFISSLRSRLPGRRFSRLYIYYIVGGWRGEGNKYGSQTVVLL